jgi:hypothetical protein
MAEGFSKPWQDAISEMTGSPEITASSFIKYFSPLYDFLEQENTANGHCIGWGGKKYDISYYNSGISMDTIVCITYYLKRPPLVNYC